MTETPGHNLYLPNWKEGDEVPRRADEDILGCLICGGRHVVHRYSEWVCHKCGQKYEYEEGHCILLTIEQREVLRKFWESSRG